MYTRRHGPSNGPIVIVLHGGPGARGSAGGLASALADPWRVLEPWQRGRAVATHIADLHAFVTAPPILVGHSWGAMLALAYAAEYPVRAVACVCSGTWELASRAAFQAAVGAGKPYDVDPLPADPLDATEVDWYENHDTWHDMLRLQAAGRYPASFAAIRAPVVMIHGAEDPHPGSMIRDSLAPYLPQLAYHELPRCGHYPWRERHARDAFIQLLRGWLAALDTST